MCKFNVVWRGAYLSLFICWVWEGTREVGEGQADSGTRGDGEASACHVREIREIPQGVLRLEAPGRGGAPLLDLTRHKVPV